jgi:hypothetical protein
VTLRKVHTVLIQANSVLDPAVGDGVSIRVETRRCARSGRGVDSSGVSPAVKNFRLVREGRRAKWHRFDGGHFHVYCHVSGGSEGCE